MSRPAYACCSDEGTEDGWMIVKTDISKPSGEEINQFLVTVGDIGGTEYGNRFYANADWEFRVRPLNRRAPAKCRECRPN